MIREDKGPKETNMTDKKFYKIMDTLSEKTTANKAIVANLMAQGPSAMRAHADKCALATIARIAEAKKRMGVK